MILYLFTQFNCMNLMNLMNFLLIQVVIGPWTISTVTLRPWWTDGMIYFLNDTNWTQSPRFANFCWQMKVGTVYESGTAGNFYHPKMELNKFKPDNKFCFALLHPFNIIQQLSIYLLQFSFCRGSWICV